MKIRIPRTDGIILVCSCLLLLYFSAPTLDTGISVQQTPQTTNASLPSTSSYKIPHVAEPLSATNTNTLDTNRPKSIAIAAPFVQRINNQAMASDGTLFPVRTYHALNTPNDPSASQPWVTAANIYSAWDTPRGSAPTLLAIIDTGVALKHEELKDRWYTNPGESGVVNAENPSKLNCTDKQIPINMSCNLIDDNGDGIVDNESGATTEENPSRLNCSDQGRALDKSCNMVDDDANGLVDDIRGWDFVHFDNSPQSGEANKNTTGGHHATYVTGVAAATANNGVGIAGVDWGTTILPLQALDDDGSGDTVAIANAINYAAARKADVISLSLGSVASDPLVRQAVQAAIAQGSVVVAAAGNDGCDCMLYPANYPEVVAVGASKADGTPAAFSSYGQNLDILAPGVNLYTSDWTPANETSAYASGISGTSLATTVISGLLTRLKSQQPTASPLQLIAALTENTKRLTLPNSIPRSNTLGFGAVDAGLATQRMSTPHSPAILYAFTPLNTGQIVSPLSPTEIKGGLPYQCDAGKPGSTPVSFLSKAGAAFYSSNIPVVEQAAAQGYEVNLFAYLCVTEPQDRPATTRFINVKSEFLNLPLSK